MSPKKSAESKKPASTVEPAGRRAILSYETGPSMSQYAARPTYVLYSDGELEYSDASVSLDGNKAHRVLVLTPRIIERLTEMIDKLQPREVKRTHKHDAKTITYSAYKTSGECIVIQSGEGEEKWQHPGADEVLRMMWALLTLAG